MSRCCPGQRALATCLHRLTCSQTDCTVPGAARATHLAWNWREILATLVASPAFAVFFCGHDHVGGYRVIGKSLHFVTLEALLEGASGLLSYLDTMHPVETQL